MGTIFGTIGNLSGAQATDWAQLTPEQKRQRRLDSFVNPPGMQFVSEKAKNNYKIRAQRLVDAYNVQEPDRVPLNLPVGNLPYTNYGINFRTAMYDYDKAVAACNKFNKEFGEELEYWASPMMATPGKILDMLDYKLYSWPGHKLGENVASVQFMEAEYMKQDEYDALILDPSDYWMRTYLPRVFGALEPFRMLRPATDMVEIVNIVQLMPLASPEMQNMLQKLMDVGKEFQKMMKAFANLGPSAAACGYPTAFGAFCKAPFDTLGDTLRGTQPILKDMYRRPDKLLEALDVVADFTIKSVLTAPNIANVFMVTYPLHKGADGWMSQKQFETFYWPSLKKVMDAFIKEGLVQSMFAEGGFNSRLETINEFPKGSVCWYFDRTDMFKAKEVLGNKCSIQGNVPSSLVVTGKPADMKEYCRKLIEGCGKGGGFILSAGAIADNPKLENLRAMIEAVNEYGYYRK
ncbi:MAG TPA: uroporphyrinogen decarboxylase family protein [Acidobacteriota bacterium]|nr:uroporphyrinogen decarboxylase family protein [Acidobacteriota bacterium]